MSLSFLILAWQIGFATVFFSARAQGKKALSMSPVTLMVGIWLAMITVYALAPLALLPMSHLTIYLVVLALPLFAIGSVVGAGGFSVGKSARGSGYPPTATESAGNVRRLATLWLILQIPASALFALFVFEGVRRFGLSFHTFGQYLYLLRTALGQGQVPLGFYFFYLAELLVPLGFILGREIPERRLVYWAMSLMWVVALTFTSGRTNAAKAIVWTAIVAIILRGHGTRLSRRDFFYGVVISIFLVTGFVFLGNQIGKSYTNSNVANILGSDSAIPIPLILPAIYFSGPLPTLDQIVSERQLHPRVPGVLIRPALQVAHLAFSHLSVPEKIQEFHEIPYPFNVSTYLGPAVDALGIPGAVLGPMIFGILVGYSERRWQKKSGLRMSLRHALILTAVIFSVVDISFNNLNWLFQLLVLCIPLERSSGQPEVSVIR